MAMKKSSITRIAALGAGLLAIALPAAALAQDEPTAPESRTSEVQTGSRLQTSTVIGAIRDRHAEPADHGRGPDPRPQRDPAGRAPGRPAPARASRDLRGRPGKVADEGT